MIYAMNTKTFYKVFTKENYNSIARTQFLVVSRRITKTEEIDEVVFARKLYPPNMLLADFMSNDPDYFKKEYIDYLDKECKMYLAVLVKGVIEYKYPIMMICTRKEWKVGYMQILMEYIKDTFGYPVVDYKEYKTKKKLPSIFVSGDEDVFTRISVKCSNIITSEERRRLAEMEKTRSGREMIVENMSTIEMIKKLKKMGLYAQSLDTKTMKSLLRDFYVEG